MSHDITDITETDEAVIIKVPVTVTTSFEVLITVAKKHMNADDIVSAIEDIMSSSFDMDEVVDGNYNVSCDDFEWEPTGCDFEFDMDSVDDQVSRLMPDEDEDEED
jgi:hypothetical protein